MIESYQYLNSANFRATLVTLQTSPNKSIAIEAKPNGEAHFSQGVEIQMKGSFEVCNDEGSQMYHSNQAYEWVNLLN